MFGWHLPDQAAHQSRFFAALKLFDGILEVIKRNHWDPNQPAWRGLAVVDQPIVGDLKAGLLYVGIFEGEQSQPERRIKNLGAYSVHLHFPNSRLRVPTSRLLARRVTRRKLGEFFS